MIFRWGNSIFAENKSKTVWDKAVNKDMVFIEHLRHAVALFNSMV